MAKTPFCASDFKSEGEKGDSEAEKAAADGQKAIAETLKAETALQKVGSNYKKAEFSVLKIITEIREYEFPENKAAEPAATAGAMISPAAAGCPPAAERLPPRTYARSRRNTAVPAVPACRRPDGRGMRRSG